MSKWKDTALSEFLTQKKRQITIDPDTEYSLVTITNKGQVKLREKKMGAAISAPKGYITKTGDFIYSRLSIHTGAFGLVSDDLDGALITNEMPCFEIDEAKILPGILVRMFGLSSVLWQLKQLTQGMGRVRIKENMMLSLSLLLPDVPEQARILSRFLRIEDQDKQLKTELAHQKALLKKLRQQILQEAIEGRLTADWRAANPDAEPASELLNRIAAEKAALLKAGKIKKQKPLAPISDQEKPFALPKGWVWCRYSEIILDIEAGKSPSCFNYPANNDEWGVLKISAVSWEKFREQENKKMKLHVEPFKNKEVRSGDFIMTRANTKELVAKSVIVENVRPKLLLNDKTLRVLFSQEIVLPFINRFNNSEHARQHYINVATGASPSMKNISRDNIKLLPLPLPPASEQKAIITKVEKLLALCDQLDTRITQNQTSAEALMQAVLREAFAASPDRAQVA